MRVDGQAALQEAFPFIKNENAAPNLETVARDKAGEPKVQERKQESRVEDVQEAVNFANKAMKMANYHLEFELHEKNNRYQVKVINSDSGETIREIPSDAMMKFAESIQSTINKAVGILVDELA